MRHFMWKVFGSFVGVTTCLVACSSTPAATSEAIPLPPTLGPQLFRMGRPLINAAANHTFDPDDASKSAAQKEWNENSDPASWVQKYATEIGKNLAIYDALDGVCGNQLFADKSRPDASRYATLASVLADDRLWIRADGRVCTIYLGVEADATKLVANRDCGGRKPDYEVVMLTYSALATGTIPASAALAVSSGGVTDGTTAVAAKTSVATFPYLAPPQ